MAVKFSEFTAKLDASVDVTEVVGYLQTGELNVRIPPANLDTTYVVSTGNAGASPTINLQGTKPNQAAAISPTTISLTGSGATLLAGNGSSIIDFGSTAYALTSTDSVVGNNSVPVVLTGTGGNDVGTDTVTIVGTGTVQVSSATNVITIDGGSVADVNSFTNVNGTYVSAATVNTAAVGDVTTGIIDLNAIDGTSDSTTRFLSKDNTWDVPSYSGGAGVTDLTNVMGTFVTGTSNAAQAGSVSLGTIDLKNNGTGSPTTPDATKFYRGDASWQTVAGYSPWSLSGQTGTAQSIGSGETVTVTSANTALTTSVAATNTLTLTSTPFGGNAIVGHVPDASGGTDNTKFLKGDGSWAIPTNSGVTSVGLSSDVAALTVGSTPVTGSGTLTLNRNGGTAGQYIDGDSGAWTDLPAGYTQWSAISDQGASLSITDGTVLDFNGRLASDGSFGNLPNEAGIYTDTAINTGEVTTGLINNGGTPSATTFYRGDGQWATVAGGYTTEFIGSSTTVSAVKNYLYILANPQAVTITLPASPSDGDTIGIANNLDANGGQVGNLLVAPGTGGNTDKIMGDASDLVLDNASAAFDLVFSSADAPNGNGWTIVGAN